MGLFHFFKTKEKQAENIQQKKSDRPECDISKTQIMADLFSVPREKRDDKWKQTFFENVQTASFACNNPQVTIGPDGFPYFALSTPEPQKPFESFCIRNMKEDFLLEKGLGITINPTDNSVEWVFSYGDIVNLHVNSEFYSKTDNIEIENQETIKKKEEVLIAQPSESYLPAQTRSVIRKYLQDKGIKQPKIMMICRKMDGTVIQELAFNIFRENFSSVEQLNLFLRQLSWFLPRHYIILSVPKDSNLTNGFHNL
ncbi:MAG TPA: hypothetical protein VF868_00005 [Bacteroidia bacterium]|jgi:hypothetical protein